MYDKNTICHNNESTIQLGLVSLRCKTKKKLSSLESMYLVLWNVDIILFT